MTTEGSPPHTDEPCEVFTLAEAARLLGISPETARRRTVAGEPLAESGGRQLHAIKAGRQYRVSRGALEEFAPPSVTRRRQQDRPPPREPADAMCPACGSLAPRPRPASRPCGCTFEQLAGTEAHDVLLSLEDGLDAVLLALEAFESEVGFEVGELSLFAKEHHWREPAKVHELVDMLVLFDERGRELDRLRGVLPDNKPDNKPHNEPHQAAGADVLRARRFELLDDKGRTRAVLGRSLDAYGLALLDEDGPRACLNIDKDGRGVQLDMSRGGNIVLRVGVAEAASGDSGPYVDLCGPGGDPVLELSVDDEGTANVKTPGGGAA